MNAPNHYSQGLAPEQRKERAQGSSLRGLINQIVHAMTETFPPGDLAELRRMDLDSIGPPAFWKAIVLFIEPAGLLPAAERHGERTEKQWAAILCTLAYTCSLHQPDMPLGQALAEAGLAEGRLVRLLRAADLRLLDEIRITARYLASKGQSVDLADLAELVLSDGQAYEDKVRRRIARRFFQTLQRMTTEKTTTGS